MHKKIIISPNESNYFKKVSSRNNRGGSEIQDSTVICFSTIIKFNLTAQFKVAQ